MSWGFYAMILFIVVSAIRAAYEYFVNPALRAEHERKNAEKAERKMIERSSRERW
jgi:hypothetical protein